MKNVEYGMHRRYRDERTTKVVAEAERWKVENNAW